MLLEVQSRIVTIQRFILVLGHYSCMTEYRPLRNLIGNSLMCSRSGLSRAYEIGCDGVVFGKLDFPSMFGSLAVAECAEGVFSFKRQGFLQPSISVRRPGSDLDHGRLLMDGWHQGGVLHLADGNRYQFVKMGFLHPEWTFSDPRGRVLARLRFRIGLSYHGDIIIEPLAKDDVNLALLLLLAMYAVVLMNDEAAATAAAAN